MTETGMSLAEKEHLDFMTETGMSLAEKETSEEQKSKYESDALEELAASEEELGARSEILQEAIKELMKLKPVCVDTGMSYEERVAMREQEMEALKKAMCILENFGDMGPDGAGGEC